MNLKMLILLNFDTQKYVENPFFRKESVRTYIRLQWSVCVYVYVEHITFWTNLHWAWWRIGTWKSEIQDLPVVLIVNKQKFHKKTKSLNTEFIITQR